jgi:hypothetical protein
VPPAVKKLRRTKKRPKHIILNEITIEKERELEEKIEIQRVCVCVNNKGENKDKKEAKKDSNNLVQLL